MEFTVFPDVNKPTLALIIVGGEIGKDWMPNILDMFFCWEHWN